MLPALASPPGMCGHVVLIKSHSWTTRKNKYHAVLRIRNVYPGSRIRIRIRIFPHPRIRIKEFKYLTQKIVSKLREIWSGLFIPDPDPYFLPIPDPGSRGQKGTGFWIPDPHHWYHVIHVWVVDLIFWMSMKQSIPLTLADDTCEKQNKINIYFLGNFVVPTSPKWQTKFWTNYVSRNLKGLSPEMKLVVLLLCFNRSRPEIESCLVFNFLWSLPPLTEQLTEYYRLTLVG